MLDPVRRMLTAASETKQTRDFWQAAARILSEWGGGTRVQLTYRGVQESGGVEVGTPGREGKPFVADYHDAEGRQVQAAFAALPAGFPVTDLRAAIEIATRLAVMVARRAALERERRLGTFLVELSRWMLAVPDRELLLRYTLQSVTNLLEAQGAYVALRQAGRGGGAPPPGGPSRRGGGGGPAAPGMAPADRPPAGGFGREARRTHRNS